MKQVFLVFVFLPIEKLGFREIKNLKIHSQ